MVGSVHRLVRWQRRLLYGAGAALLASGVGWLAVHYGRSVDALPSPLEAWAMRIHGYEDTGQPIEAVVPALLAEITLNATPDELLAIAEFLRQCARER